MTCEVDLAEVWDGTRGRIIIVMLADHSNTAIIINKMLAEVIVNG